MAVNEKRRKAKLLDLEQDCKAADNALAAAVAKEFPIGMAIIEEVQEASRGPE